MCVVEGHGEVAAAPVLIGRILRELLGIGPGEWVVNRDPVRVSRALFKQASSLQRYLVLASRRPRVGGVLVLCDADDACPARWSAVQARSVPGAETVAVRSVMACREYESWVLWGYDPEVRARVKALDPEVSPRDAKGALARLRPGYTPSAGQVAVTRELDLRAVWARSDSFDKLVRSVAELVGTEAPARVGG